MPLTFPSHAAAVLPLKLWRRRWFDGVALVIGSGSPDYIYAVDPYVRIDAHTWWGIAWFCVPATLVLTGLCRLGAPAVATHLARAPGGRAFALNDYAAVGWHRHRFMITIASAFIGAASHRLWDLFTHESLDDGATRIGFVSDVVINGQPLWHILQHTSTVVGGVAAIAMARYIARVRWLRESGLPRLSYLPRVFWAATAALWSAGVALLPWLRGTMEPSVGIIRLMCVACLGLLAGAGAVGFADLRRRSNGRGSNSSGSSGRFRTTA